MLLQLGGFMKTFIFFGLFVFSGFVSAAEIKCIPTTELKIEGMPFYLYYNITTDANDETQLSEVLFQSLAENGFYSEFPLEITSGIFAEYSHVAFETIADGQGSALYAKYNSTNDNYVGSVFFENSTEILGVKCMKLKAF